MQSCSVCVRPDVETLNAALRAGDTLRVVGHRFGVHFTTVGKHARHSGIAETVARRRKRAARSKRSQAASVAAAPVEMPTDREGVAAMLWAQYLETWSIVEASSDDLKQKNAAIATSRAITADFAKLLGVNVEAGVTVNVDRSTTKVLAVLADLSDDELRALLVDPQPAALPPGDVVEAQVQEVVADGNA
jgi:hypothetical protein